MFFFGKKRNQRSRIHADPPRQGASGFCAAVVSDIGCLRENNEDNYLLLDRLNADSSDHSEAVYSGSFQKPAWVIAGVFDGIGGGEAGELASRGAAECVRSAWKSLEPPDRDQADTAVRAAFLEANNRILSLPQSNVFGTTGTVLCTDGSCFKLYHLGDSRAYLLRNGVLQQLTRDQTLAQMKLEMGMYKENDPAAEADKHKLTEYIGRDRTGRALRPVESHWYPVCHGDVILLCSDGLYDMCSDEEILQVLSSANSPGEKAAALVCKALQAGGQDNVTCLLAEFILSQP